jgi:hypothetical protein
MEFATFVFDQLPPAPRRVLEIGCGREGGLVEQLVGRGYDGEWDAVVAGRMLHHVNPLDESLDKLARLAPLLLVDEFAWNLIDAAAQDWYEGQHRMLRAAGAEPYGPASLVDWRLRHQGLHSDEVVLRALRERYDEIAFERVPYMHRWLGGPSSEALEQSLVDAGAFPAIGYRWAGSSTSTTRSSAESR